MYTFTPQKLTLFSIIVLLAGAAWTFASRVPPGSPSEQAMAQPHQGFLAPDFSLQTPDGELVSLSELRGHPVLVNIWTSWCPPCRAEMPAIQKIYDEYRSSGLVVLAVNATNQDTPSDAIAFTQEYGLTFPTLLDMNGEVSRLYALQALPTTYFIGSDGIIKEVVIGGPMSEALLRIRVEQLVKGKP